MTTSILHRALDKSYPCAVRGQGCYLYTEEGRQVLDGCSGAAVSCLGHGHKEVVEAIKTQADALCFAHTSFFTSNPAEELATNLIESSDGAFSHVMFLSSGSEAVESAIKIARQYQVYTNNPQRAKVIGREYSYHGNTLGALSAGYNPSRREVFAPLLSPAFHHVRRCFIDRDGAGQDEAAYEDALIAEYEAKFNELGPDTIAAVIVEPVVGATLGSVPATKTYLPRLRDLCHRQGALVIFDEVMCGMGRTGTYHAWQQLGNVAPDLQTIGKGLGAGYQPISAILMSSDIHNRFRQATVDGMSPFVSGHTYQGHAIGCAAALAVCRILGRDRLLDNVVEMGELLKSRLRASIPKIVFESGGSVRGLGLFRTVDLGTLGNAMGGPLAAEVAVATFAQGAAVYTCSAAVDAVLFCPPFIITASQVNELVGAFVRGLESVLHKRAREVLSN